MYEVIFWAYGEDLDQATIEVLREIVKKSDLDVLFCTDGSELARQAVVMVESHPWVDELDTLKQAPDKWEKIDSVKKILDPPENIKPIIAVVSPSFINEYFDMQYGQNVSIKTGEAIGCNDFSLPFWAGEFERI